MGFASPRHLLQQITPRERNEWLAFLALEAERNGAEVPPDRQDEDAAWDAWVKKAKGGDRV